MKAKWAGKVPKGRRMEPGKQGGFEHTTSDMPDQHSTKRTP